ncbi:ktrB domain protein, partial [Vibrio parahaemolyticus SBR10290]
LVCLLLTRCLPRLQPLV